MPILAILSGEISARRLDGVFSHAQPIGYLLVRVAIGDETNSDACLLALIY
jgi:hypothetical protein